MTEERHSNILGITLLALCSLNACAPCRPAGGAAPAEPRSPGQVGAMLARYATCRHYEDHGLLTEVRRPDDGSPPGESRATFRTLFQRETGSFRFEYDMTEGASTHQRAVVWRRGAGDARRWWTVTNDVLEGDLSEELEALAGVSRGATVDVPAMLLRRGGDRLSGAEIQLGQELIQGVLCSRISAHRGDERVTVWIALSDSSLRKIFEKRHLSGVPPAPNELGLSEQQRAAVAKLGNVARPFVVETTIEYAPVFDNEIDPELFAFSVPRNPKADPPREP